MPPRKRRPSMIQKVVVNVGRGRARGQRTVAQPPVSIRPPQMIFNAVNPALDPFAIRQQMAIQQLTHQNQLKVNQDLLTSLRAEVMELKDARTEPTLKPVSLAPSFDALVLNESPHVRLNSETPKPVVPRFAIGEAGSVKVVNPKTGREIAYGGKKYKQLVNDGVLVDTLVPSQDVDEEKDIDD